MKTFLLVFTGMTSVLLAGSCHGDRMTYGVGEGGDWKLSEEMGDIRLLCLLLHILIHLLV
jgi:hypothetical protein